MEVSTTTTTNTSITNGLGILQFLPGKTYFITGATGFLAKAVIEKILRTAPDVGKIFVLIKAKNKEAATDRLKTEIIDSELFGCLKQRHGKYYEDFMLSKLAPVVGNLCEPDLGIDANSISEIAEEVDVIINSAANTNFEERYDVSLSTNVLGPRRLMDFTNKYCKNLRVFLHVSTAYVCGEREGMIVEKPFHMGESIAREKAASEFPPLSYPVLDVDGEIEIALDSKVAFEDNLEDQKMKALGLERARIHGWHNPYEFTKAMGEMMINSMRGDIPLVIIRPTVIGSTLEDPFPGWIQGNRMLDPLILSYGKGNLPSFLVNPEAVIDMVDSRRHGCECNHSSYGKALVLLLWEDRGHEGNGFFSSMDDFSSNMQTEIVQQRRLVISGNNASQRLERKCKMIVEHAINLARVYQPYMFFRGRFDNSNTHNLMEGMSEEEMKRFRLDVENVDWEDYITNIHISGLKKHVMKGRGMPK
ncbi:Fatty acyl-CoA reductase 2 [Vitis vinifera]|uniref:Fatty acyl-CoA reductase n=1 Tax=Vitis vinifera TaxID=29760 RepID=A0A438I6G6_VITVI|nr:Fatty acyl-CoA reductase 2 [Vitis vinifera]